MTDPRARASRIPRDGPALKAGRARNEPVAATSREGVAEHAPAPANLPLPGLGALGVALFLAVWELAARLAWHDPQVLPAPTQALASAWWHLTLAELAAHVGVSLSRIVVGFAIAAVVGI